MSEATSTPDGADDLARLAHSAPPFRGVSSSFRALCAAAAAGGTTGYGPVGLEFAQHLHERCPEGVTPAEWGAALEQFRAAVLVRDERATLAWIEQRLPSYLRLIPVRRRPAFLSGILEYALTAWA